MLYAGSVAGPLSQLTCVNTSLEEDGDQLKRVFYSYLGNLFTVLSERREQDELTILDSRWQFVTSLSLMNLWDIYMLSRCQHYQLLTTVQAHLDDCNNTDSVSCNSHVQHLLQLLRHALFKSTQILLCQCYGRATITIVTNKYCLLVHLRCPLPSSVTALLDVIFSLQAGFPCIRNHCVYDLHICYVQITSILQCPCVRIPLMHCM